MTTQIAKGPNGQPMLSVVPADKEKDAQAQAGIVFMNLLHDAADRLGDREKIEKDEMLVEDVKLDKKGITRKEITNKWAVPIQIPSGPHMGKWCIPVPADIKLREQRDPKTGEVKDETAPAWKTPEIVERDPAWFPSEEEV